ncbi:MAG: PHP domain-containing protein [Candidatus Helarchaeota archaeon]
MKNYLRKLFDLHIHSKYSFDSYLSPKKIVKLSIKNGLTGIAITDHNSIKGAKEAYNYVQKNNQNLIVVIGAEFNTDFGEIIGLFIENNIKSRDPLTIIEGIKAQDGFVILPHPYKRGILHQDKSIMKMIDAVEIFNARTTLPNNFKALELCHRFNKIPVCGSDAHFCFELGRTYLSINNCIQNNNDLISALLNKNFRIFGTKNLSLFFKNITKSYRKLIFITAKILKREYRNFYGEFIFPNELLTNIKKF